MSTRLLLKPALISLTIISLLSSCTKNEARHKPLTANKTQAAQSEETKIEPAATTQSASSDLTKAASTDSTKAVSADSTRAASADSSRALSIDSTQALALNLPAIKTQKLNTPQQGADAIKAKITAQPKAEAVKKVEVANEVAASAAAADDSEQIKKSNDLKISIKDLKSLIQLSQNSEIVMHQQKIVKESEMKTQILKANEDSYCKVKIQGNVLDTDYLKLDKNEMAQTNKEFDVYESQLSFKNSKASIAFNCVHTTSNFFVEDFSSNFSSILNVYNIDGEIFDLKNYVNPRTERRMLNAIQLVDTDKLEQVVLDEKTKDAHALSHGQVDSTDRVSNFISAGKEKIACMVAEKAGDFDKSKVYIRVEKGIAMDTPKNIPVATMYAIYRADEKNYFVLTCLMQKTAEWSELFDAAKGVFKFEALSRLEYNKKFDEVSALHKKLSSKN